MGPVRVERHGAVTVVRMDADENRFHPDLLAPLERALDDLERPEGPAALVTVGSGRFYSNGLDLEHMASLRPEGVDEILGRVLRLLARVLVLPVPTVAAVNGHAFAAGAMFALAHDLRIMRRDRGWFCIPEVDLRMPLHPGLLALIRARLPVVTAHEAVALGRRYPAEEAWRAGAVQQVAEEEEVLPAAIALAGELAAKAHPVMGALKRALHAEVLRALSEPLPDSMRHPAAARG